MKKILPVILSGGKGARLWPLSSENCPKQFHNLNSDYPLIIETINRVAGENFLPPLIVSNEEYRGIISGLLKEYDIVVDNFITEPVSKNTAPAICVAAIYAQQKYGSDVELIILPSDHVIEEGNSKFVDSIRLAQSYTGSGSLVCFGVKPDRPETGYGYIKQGSKLGEGVFSIASFTEKPNIEEAKKLIDSELYSWNSGIFIFTAGTILEEVRNINSEIHQDIERSFEEAFEGDDFIRVNKEYYKKLPNISIDSAVMERTNKGVVIPIDFKWSDIGTFSSLWEISKKDEQGNVISGKVKKEDTKDCYIKSNGPMIATAGVSDLIIVVEDDVTLVVRKGEDGKIKKIVDGLNESNMDEALRHSSVKKPWGSYKNLESEEGSLIKIITVSPNNRISLQKHEHRSEHWICLSGKGVALIDGESKEISENEHLFLPKGASHRLENNGEKDLKILEIQIGDKISEGDIIRIEDDFYREDFKQ